ncbi:hypothetical protein VB005_10171 [Metarhizium brunneum]
MSIFAHIKKSRQQAKEHNAKLVEQKKKESDQVPYKHVPTHAATDAFASAPPSWREADRSRIIEQNRRRSAMAASGHHMSMPGVPRVGSSLSRVSYPGEGVAATIRMPRPYSYAGISPFPGVLRDSREMVYTAPDMTYVHPGSLKGKEVPRVYDSQRISPASSKGDPSPVESSSDSTSSQDDLEMKPSNAARARAGDGAKAHRLHPSRARRISDVSANQYTLSNIGRGNTSNYTRDSRPPPSMRGFGSIPTVPVMPPMNIGVLPGTIAAHGYNGTSPSNTLTPTSRRSSSTSLPGLSGVSTRQTASASMAPAVSSAHKSEYPLNRLSISSFESGVPTPSSRMTVGQSAGAGIAMAYSSTSQASSNGRHSQDVDSMRQDTWQTQAFVPDHHQHMDRSRPPSTLAHGDLVNVFPEQAGLEAAPSKGGKSKKLSKTGGGKLFKKNRWSSSKVSVVAV